MSQSVCVRSKVSNHVQRSRVKVIYVVNDVILWCVGEAACRRWVERCHDDRWPRSWWRSTETCALCRWIVPLLCQSRNRSCGVHATYRHTITLVNIFGITARRIRPPFTQHYLYDNLFPVTCLFTSLCCRCEYTKPSYHSNDDKSRLVSLLLDVKSRCPLHCSCASLISCHRSSSNLFTSQHAVGIWSSSIICPKTAGQIVQ